MKQPKGERSRIIQVRILATEWPKLLKRASQHANPAAWIRYELGLPEIKAGRPRKSK